MTGRLTRLAQLSVHGANVQKDHTSWTCGGYAWSVKRAWKTSRTPTTRAFQARISGALPGTTTAGSYKTVGPAPR